MVSAVFRKIVIRLSCLHDGPLRYRPLEYGNFGRGTVCQSGKYVDNLPVGRYYLRISELRHDDLGHLPQPVPEYLQALPGEPEIFAACGPDKGPG